MPQPGELEFHAYKSDEQPVPDQPGLVTHTILGCSGEHHAAWVDQLTRGAQGEILGGAHLRVDDLGPCDQSCRFGLKAADGHGGFLHAPAAAPAG